MPVAPGRPARHDYEYKRNGTANLFMLFAPLEGWRHVKPTARRTAVDYAHVLKEVSDVHFPRARTIVLVQDNLNTHAPSSLYEAFPPAEARRIAERFEWHYSPKHGSWLNMAEAELSILARQCLDRRIPDVPTLEQQVSAWLLRRNKHHAKADWPSQHKARIKRTCLSVTLRPTGICSQYVPYEGVTVMRFKVASRVRGLSDTRGLRYKAVPRGDAPGAGRTARLPLLGHRGHCVLAGRGLYQCNRCKKQTSPTGRNKLPLTLWFAAIHLITRTAGGTRPPSRGGRWAVKHNGDGAARGGDAAYGAGRDGRRIKLKNLYPVF